MPLQPITEEVHEEEEDPLNVTTKIAKDLLIENIDWLQKVLPEVILTMSGMRKKREKIWRRRRRMRGVKGAIGTQPNQTPNATQIATSTVLV